MIKTTREIQNLFENYFETHGHTILPPSALISPESDTTMFTIAGMKQFADVFLGYRKLQTNKVSTSQPCLRVGGHNCDLDNVGRTTRHMTFFTMLGNFSFGDYFREKAIFYAYDFLVNYLKLNAKNLYITVYYTDEESLEEWKKYFDESKIFKINTDDNFWSSGTYGPCGPCTEIYYDTEELEENVSLDKFLNSEGRFLEIWNIVLMQYNKTPDGLLELKVKNIDTGMGLERIASVVNKTFDAFQTDSLLSIVNFCKDDTNNIVDAKIVADHMRASIALIYEGLIPSAEDRGYVLRKLLRRSKMKYNDSLSKVAEFILNNYNNIYGEKQDFSKKKDFIIQTIIDEEDQTNLVIESGMEHLRKIDTLNEEIAVNLNTTYGIPLELINEYCEQTGEKLDQSKIQTFLKMHCDASKKKLDIQYHTDTIFTGYDKTEDNSVVVDIILTNENNSVFIEDYAEHCKDFFFITKESCFYAKGGGQEGDQGIFKGDNFSGKVIDTLRCKSNTGYSIIHHAQLCSGIIKKGDKIKLEVNTDLRQQRCRAHTSTHILFDYLHDKYKCQQVGSFVDADRARLDVTIDMPIKDQIKDIENYVNKIIKESIDVEVFETKFENIKDKIFIGANNKYGEIVRVIKVANYSQELCGGTHVKNTRDIKQFKILKESSIKKGIRRLEFATYNIEEYNNKPNEEKKEKEKLQWTNKITNQYTIDKISVLFGDNCSKNFILLRIDERKDQFDYILAFYTEQDETKFTVFSNKTDLTKIRGELVSKFNLKGGGDQNKQFFSMMEYNSEAILEFFKNI